MEYVPKWLLCVNALVVGPGKMTQYDSVKKREFVPIWMISRWRLKCYSIVHTERRRNLSMLAALSVPPWTELKMLFWRPGAARELTCSRLALLKRSWLGLLAEVVVARHVAEPEICQMWWVLLAREFARNSLIGVRWDSSHLWSLPPVEAAMWMLQSFSSLHWWPFPGENPDSHRRKQ